MKKVCFCVLIGDYDTLQNPLVISEGWEYICITDQDIKSDIWKIIKVKSNDLDSRWFSRYIWTHFYNYFDCDIALKHDASMNIIGNLNDLLFYLNDNIDICISKHDRRNCIYDEADAVNFRFPEYTNLVNKQIEQYKNEGYPNNYGLYYQGIRLMKNNEKIKYFNNIWWNEIENGSWRDQLSFDYVRWKLKNINFNITIQNLSYSKLTRLYFSSKSHK